MPPRKNDETDVVIRSLTSEGAGIAKIDGFAVFVPGTLPGEKCRVHITKVNKSYGYAKLLNVITPSPDRIVPDCKYFGLCGGCALRFMSYGAELAFKRQVVADALARIGGTETFVHETIGARDYNHYRNKAQFPVGSGGIGFYAPRSHRICDIESCMIQHKDNDRVIAAVREWINEHGIAPYDEQSHSGTVRHIFTRTGMDDSILVCLVTRTKDVPALDCLIDKLTRLDLNLRGIVQNINAEKTNVITGREYVTLYGEDYIYGNIGHIRLKVSLQSFCQVNTRMAEVLYDKAAELAALTGTERVLDLFCGTGSIGLYLARGAKLVTGVEVVPEAVRDAQINAGINGTNNAEFFVGTAESYDFGLNPDIIIIDPPRKGCAPELIDKLTALSPRKIIYISCNPATLARDISILRGYTVCDVYPVDMFPRTYHVETVALLSKIKSTAEYFELHPRSWTKEV